MKKRILTLFCVLVLSVLFSVTVFAAPTPGGSFNVDPDFSIPVQDGDYFVENLDGVNDDNRMYVNRDSSKKFIFTSVSEGASAVVSYALVSSGGVVTYHDIGALVVGFSFVSSAYPAADFFTVRNNGSNIINYWVTVVDDPFGVSPAFSNPIQPGEYDVTDLIGTQTTNRMYTVRDDPKTFTFSDVTANASTVVSYAIASEGGTISYHNIGTLTEGFTFSSADYPVASFFTVRNTGSSLASYTVMVENDNFEKSQGIAKSIWETCLEMGTSLVNWLKTPVNWIALLPLVMFIAVGAVLIIRKLIKGV